MESETRVGSKQKPEQTPFRNRQTIKPARTKKKPASGWVLDFRPYIGLPGFNMCGPTRHETLEEHCFQRRRKKVTDGAADYIPPPGCQSFRYTWWGKMSDAVLCHRLDVMEEWRKRGVVSYMKVSVVSLDFPNVNSVLGMHGYSFST